MNAVAHALIDVPGHYPEIGEEAYHRDPVIVPSLSASIANLLATETPAHARLAHPRLNPDLVREHADHLDVGAGAHALLLEGRNRFQVIEADSYQTKAAREARDAARAAGRLPVLARKLPAIEAMVEAAKGQIRAHPHISHAFANFAPEQTLVWQEGKVWCRARLDVLPFSGNVFPDYKTKAESVAAGPVTRHAFDMGYDVRAAFYMRGIRAVLGVERPRYALVVQEKKPPYTLQVFEFDAMSLAIAEEKLQAAIDLWQWCLAHDRWPGHRRDVHYIEAPVYVQREWEGRLARRTYDLERKLKLFETMLEWQAPDQPANEQDSAA